LPASSPDHYQRIPASRRRAVLPVCALVAVIWLHRPAESADGIDSVRTAETAASEEASDTAKTDDRSPALQPIVVEADDPADAKLVERSFDTPDDSTGFGETIAAEPGWRSFQSTADLLGQSVGAQLRRQGGRDDFATLSIRGAPSAQLRILLDGIALGRASDSVVNLADLPLDTVERIEVYRGFSPVSLTPTSAAGVVNIVTRDPKAAVATAAVGGGSFGTVKVHAGGAGPVAGGSAAAFASWRRTDGNFEYRDDNGTVNNPADDRTRSRANNDSETLESLLRWRRDLTESANLQLREHVFHKDEGVPGLARFAPPTARLETTRNIAAASIGAPDRRWSIEEAVTWEKRRLSDYGAFDNRAETTASTTVGRWGLPVGDAHWLSGSGEFTWEGFEQANEAPALPRQEASRSSLALALGDDWTLAPIDTTLTFQLRHQQLWSDQGAAGPAGSGDAHSTDPRVGLRWRAFGGFDVKANVSSYFRPPSFDEMFGTDGFTTGNPALKPEEGLAWDAGFEWKGSREPFGSLALGYAWYGSDIDDVILVILTFDRTAKAVNAASARIRGHEARVEWKGPAGFALSANYTFQDAENRSPALRGRDLPGLPPHELYARLSWSIGRVVLAYDIDLSSEHFVDSDNAAAPLPTRTVHGVSLVIGPFLEGLRLTLEADNLGDTLVPDQIGFPLPGRSFYATLSWSDSAADGTRDER
jgi:outer membrane receptor protein involved in Fe transport